MKFLSLIQVIAIIMVVLYHSFQQWPGGGYGFDLWGMRLMASLHVPAFMFVSGLLLELGLSRKPVGMVTFAARKLRRLMVPYLVLSLVTFVPRAMMSGMADDAVELSAAGLWHGLVHTPSLILPYFWFLQVLAVMMIVGYLTGTLARRFGVAPVSAWTAILLVFILIHGFALLEGDTWALRRISKYGIYFLAGGVACRFRVWFEKFRITFPEVLLSAAAWVVTFHFFEADRWLESICGLSGILFLVLLTRLMEQRSIGLLDPLIGANYMIFLLSWYFNVATQQVLSHIITLPWPVHTILSLTFGIAVPACFYRYLRNHPASRWARVSAWLLGQ